MMMKHKITAAGVAALIFLYIERKITMSEVKEQKLVNKEVKEQSKMKTEVKKNTTMTHMEKEELSRRVKAMSREELEIVLNNIPIELCLMRIEREFDRLKAFEDSVKSAVSGVM